MLKRIHLVVIIGFVQLSSQGQPANFFREAARLSDSFHVKGHQSVGDKEREAGAWLKSAGEKINWKESNYPEILYSLEQALALYQQINNKEKEIQTLQLRAYLYIITGNAD